MNPQITLHATDWLHLVSYYLTLSLMSVGGAIATAPDMHRFLVGQQGWISEVQFNNSIAIAQSAPGPNILFVGLFGWNLGLNAASGMAHGWLLGTMGLVLCMVSMLLPSSALTWLAIRWAQRHHERRSLRAFRQGMSPLVVGLICSTGWVLAGSHGNMREAPPLWCATALTALIVWRTRIHLLWLLAAGAALGALGIV